MEKDRICGIDVDTIYDFIEKEGVLYKPGVEVIKGNLELITKEMNIKEIVTFSLCDHHYGDLEHAVAEPELTVNGGQFPLHALAGTIGSMKITETYIDRRIYISTDLPVLDFNFHFHDEIGQPFLQYVIEKQGINGMFKIGSPGGNIHYEQLLEIFDIQTCFVYGVYTEYCILANVISLLESGREVYVVTDAIYPYDDGTTALKDMAQMGAKFITTKEFIQLLRNNFGT